MLKASLLQEGKLQRVVVCEALHMLVATALPLAAIAKSKHAELKITAINSYTSHCFLQTLSNLRV
jgi:hypothetical protein